MYLLMMIYLKKDFDSMMIHTRNVMLKLMGIKQACAAQVIEDRSNVPKKCLSNN